MLRGFYAAATGMIAQQRRTEMLTNNMSNANTPGFKADQSSIRAFPEMLLQHFDQKTVPTQNGLNLPNERLVGAINTGVYMQETMPTFKQGDLQETQKTTDMALVDIFMPVGPNGKNASVFFTVANDQGNVSYTRNGNFTLDQQGYLTTPRGHYVLDTEGERIQLASDQFKVNENGEVYENDQLVARLGVAYAEDPYQLIKEGDGLFRMPEGGQLPILYNNAIPEVDFAIQQGAIERSNVDPSRAMTEMLTAYRAFEANQKVLQAYDQSMQKTVTEIGRI